MVSATSCLIIFTCPNHNQRIVIICRLSIDKTLARISRLSANHANCMKLIHLIGNAHQFRYRLIRLCPEAHIKTCDNHSFPIFHILLAKINNLFPKKLYFINANHFSINIFFHNFFHLGNIAHRIGPETVIFMWKYSIFPISVVNRMFKCNYFLFCILCTSKPSYKLLAFSWIHASSNDFQCSNFRILYHFIFPLFFIIKYLNKLRFKKGLLPLTYL